MEPKQEKLPKAKKRKSMSLQPTPKKKGPTKAKGKKGVKTKKASKAISSHDSDNSP